MQLCDKISNLLSFLGQSPEIFTGRILFMSMFNDISCDRYDNKDECFKECRICEDICKKIWNWSMGLSLDQVLRKSGILPRIVHKELGTMLRKRCY